MKRAFVVIPAGWPIEHAGIYAAESASKARFMSWQNSQESGYCHSFAQLRVLRLPDMDAWAAEQPEHGRYSYSGWIPDALPGGAQAVMRLARNLA